MNVKSIIKDWSIEDLRNQISTVMSFPLSYVKPDELQQLQEELNSRSSDYHLLGCCYNQSCNCYGGGWKYSVTFLVDKESECSCPECGGELTFIVKEGGL